jgi:hypothetical protein
MQTVIYPCTHSIIVRTGDEQLEMTQKCLMLFVAVIGHRKQKELYLKKLF